VCIVGLGTIGQQLVDRLRPFGMKMIATDEHPENAPADVHAYPADELNTAVAHADFVVICVRASKENENLIDAAALAAMKRVPSLSTSLAACSSTKQHLLVQLRKGNSRPPGSTF